MKKANYTTIVVVIVPDECLSKVHIMNCEKESNKEKRILAMCQESFLERISLPIIVLAMIGLDDTNHLKMRIRSIGATCYLPP